MELWQLDATKSVFLADGTGGSCALVEAVVTAAQAGRVEAMSNRNPHRLPAI